LIEKNSTKSYLWRRKQKFRKLKTILLYGLYVRVVTSFHNTDILHNKINIIEKLFNPPKLCKNIINIIVIICLVNINRFLVIFRIVINI